MKTNIQDLIQEIIKDKNKLTLAIILIVIILCLDFIFVLKSQSKALSSLKTKTSKLKNDLKNLKTDMSRMQVSRDKSKPLQLKRIIRQGEVSWLIEEIYNLSNKNNVKILQITPETTVTSSKSVVASRYIAVPLNIDLTSGYNALVKFIEVLEAHPVIMAIEDLEVMRKQDDIFSHQISLNLNTYVKK